MHEKSAKLNFFGQIRIWINHHSAIFFVFVIWLHSLLLYYIHSLIATFITSGLLVFIKYSFLNPVRSARPLIISFITYYVIFFGLSSSKFTYFHRCFIYLIYCDLQYSFGYIKKRMYFVLGILLIFMFSSNFKLTQIASIAFIIGISFLPDMIQKASKDKHIKFNLAALIISAILQIAFLKKIHVQTFLLACLLSIPIPSFKISYVSFTSYSKGLLLYLILTMSIMCAELVIYYKSKSLILLVDITQFLYINIAVLIAIVVSAAAHQSATKRFSFGIMKIDYIGTCANFILKLICSCFFGFFIAFRFLAPVKVAGTGFITISILGSCAKLARYLFKCQKNVQTNVFKGLVYEVSASVIMVISNVIIKAFEYSWLDPLVAIVLIVLNILSTVTAFKNSISMLLLTSDKANVPEVTAMLQNYGLVDNLNIYDISDSFSVATTTITKYDSISISHYQEMLTQIISQFQQSHIHDVTVEILSNAQDQYV